MKLAEKIAAARGDVTVDLLLTNARLVNVLTGEIHPADVAVYQGEVVGFGHYRAKEVVDLAGKLLMPGFIDGHVHLESSMVEPAEFARAVVPQGTTTVIADPHEIANVAGLAGIRYILNSTENLPLNVYVMLPSCVPATSLETAGAVLQAEDLASLIHEERVLGLGEFMDYPGVVGGHPQVLAKLQAAAGKHVDGHAPRLSGKGLQAYAVAGVRTDHECTTAEEAWEKLRAGIRLMVREGSATRDVAALLPAITPLNSRRCLFVTDDRHPEDLVAEGSINFAVKKAISLGLDPVIAVQMATINAAECFGLKHLGAIAPGYQADMVVVNDWHEFTIEAVYHKGKRVEPDKIQKVWVDKTGITHSVRMAPTKREDLAIPGEGSMLVRVIGLIPHQVVTRHLLLPMTACHGELRADMAQDILKLVVVERHTQSGRIGKGFIQGLGLTAGAVGCTVSHDSHNLVVAGTNDDDILTVIERIREMQGGIAVVCNGEIRADLPLPIAGLISEEPLAEVRRRLQNIYQTLREMGAKPHDPLMTLAFMSLAVIPELKLTDRGLVDVNAFSVVEVAAGKAEF